MPFVPPPEDKPLDEETGDVFLLSVLLLIIVGEVTVVTRIAVEFVEFVLQLCPLIATAVLPPKLSSGSGSSGTASNVGLLFAE